MTQTIVATREESTTILGSLFASKPKVIDPTALVNTALAGFQQAADNLVAAQGVIATQKAQHEAEALAATAKAEVCSEQHSRLSRIQERLVDFLA